MFVGGEFYYDEEFQVEKPGISTDRMTFLNGGKACLIVICDYLRDHGIDRILLPAYLCPTIVNTLERCGMTCAYYPVRPDLSIDLAALERIAEGHKAVYFINYFGFSHAPETRCFLAELQQSGKMLIEDNAQAGFVQDTVGDFVFNSMRKLVPYDGGYLLTTKTVQPYLERNRNLPNRRLPVIREYRRSLANYLLRGTGEHASLVDLYEEAESVYEADMVVEGDAQEQTAIEHLDWQAIKQKRRENYAYLLRLVTGIAGVKVIFPALQPDNMPMGLPVYIESVPRDWLLDELGEAGIGLTVHWGALRQDQRLNGNPEAVEMAGSMLTLAIDQRQSRRQLNYQAERLYACIRKFGSSKTPPA